MPSTDHKFVGLHICCRRHHTRLAYRPSETS